MELDIGKLHTWAADLFCRCDNLGDADDDILPLLVGALTIEYDDLLFVILFLGGDLDGQGVANANRTTEGKFLTKINGSRPWHFGAKNG